ncbi:FtsX-like permease family protein [Enterococcus sp. AZ103]|uniref:FtsX-like permease family protein n=1 Tax=Enterococcus sp. AZ103 TaxID=2774628 RepID=UPI003F205B3F
MLIKLMWRGFVRQLSNYLLFLVSMIFAVMLYYSFVTITKEQPIIQTAGNNAQVVSVLTLGIVAIVFILVYFMLTTNRFFIENRRKDISIFHLFGLKFYQIYLWFAFELLLLGGISFIIGIALGMLFSKLLSMILVFAMGLNIAVDFFVSFEAITSTATVLIFLLLLVAIQTLWLVSSFKFSWENQKISFPQLNRKKRFQKITAILGIVFLAVGWGSAIFFLRIVQIAVGKFYLVESILVIMLIIFVICIIGTYLFFACTLPYYQKRKVDSVYRDLKILTRSENLAYYYKNWRLAGTMTILLGLALAFLGATTAVVSLSMNNIREFAPVSLMIDQENYQTIKNEVSQLSGYQATILSLKLVGGQQTLRIVGEGTDEKPQLFDLISQSNYLRFRKINPQLAKVDLSGNQAIMFTPVQSILKDYIKYSSKIHLADRVLQVKGVETNYLGDTSLRLGQEIIVVSDETYQAISGVSYKLAAVNVANNETMVLQKIIDQKLTSKWIDPIKENLEWHNNKLSGEVSRTEENQENAAYRINYVSKSEIYRSTRNQVGLLLFMMTFVVVTFIVTMASTASMRQLSDLPQKRDRIKLLKQMGIPNNYLVKQIYRENFVVFFPTAAIGLLHSCFAILVFQQLVANASYWFVYLFCGVLLIIYFIFYWGICQYQKRLI